ncbi:alpha/beta hydrolase [Brevibacillus ruminantium]|uniref:Alpha/beta hydrolase n=1 Tax=Brevibacillus ruminantium TaxID=2950604 RepID=A0ABY4WBU8_9BACL|nr:alpha/beta fold hydrolase [Brevibacillus ruminantium]USG64655.1 alpha/beta hydrolase [Brevibacillus ruminantium]
MKKRFLRYLLYVFIIIALLVAAIAWFLDPYRPDEAAMQAMKSGNGVKVEEVEGLIIFEGGENNPPGVIFYPGGLVGPESYAPIARLLALSGHRTVIVKMPMNLAITGVDRADDVLKGYPKETFVIGGHSLGGVMAARYAAVHPEKVAGVFLLASYPDQKGNLKESGLPVLSLIGSRDGVMNRTEYEKARQFLPDHTTYLAIPGGNHAQFGSYGAQKGDQPAVISPEDQWQQTTALLRGWMKSVLDIPGK